jgi:hypothetical protein
MDTSIFVNRDRELGLIREAVEILRDERRLLRTPIIEFSGVQGIGKTTLLQQIRLLCDREKLLCIVNDAKQITTHDLKNVEFLIKERPVAFILDTLDAVDNDLFQAIEIRLSKLVESSRLFVILGSRVERKFERVRSIARKLTIIPLQPLNHESCLKYLDHFTPVISSDSRNIILDWTYGYPLAMDIMTRAILDRQLDLAKEEDRKQLMNTLGKEVIEEKLLVTASSSGERIRLQSLLALLSVPRRFNLILAQDLIKRFTPQYDLGSSLAYITLPKVIEEVTSVLSWKLERAGYSIDEPIRKLFLVQYKIEQPQKLGEIHAFLADKNKQFIAEVSGSDRIRCLWEFLYHLAYSQDEAKVQEALAQHFTQSVQVPVQDEQALLQLSESLVQLYEEFQRDQELKESLGPQNTSFALSLMYRSFLEIYRQFPENERINWLRIFFSLVTQKPQSSDFAVMFEEGMRQIAKQVSGSDAIMLYKELMRDKEIEALLGAIFEEVSRRILDELNREEGP